MQHAGREQDEDPGVDDGVDGDEDEGDQVQPVGLAVQLDGVDVHSDLGRRGEGEGSKDMSGLASQILPQTQL